MTHVTRRLTAKNRDQLRNPTLGNRVWASFTFTCCRVSQAVPVEVPRRELSKRPLAACVHVAYKHLDPARLVEWFELQRILGVSRVGVYLMNNFSQAAERVFRYAPREMCSHRM